MAISLTLTGNEITDATRIAGLSGDGCTPEGSMGIWEATTNLCTNGGFETNTTGWTGGGGGVVGRDASLAKFGAACGKFTKNADGNTNVGYASVTVVSGQTYTLSAWIYVPSSFSGSEVRFAHDGTLGGSQYVLANLGLRDQWQKVSITNTATGTTAYIICRQVGAANGDFIYMDGVQAEQQPLATPYVETDGGTVARASSRVQVPVSYLDETQGWVAVRLRYPWGTANEPSGGASADYLFAWRDDLNNRIVLYYNEADDKVKFLRVAAGAGATRAPAQTAPSAGYQDTVIAKWTATTTGLSLAGSAFDSGADANVPTLAATTFDIGTQLGLSWIDADIFWFACGTGTVTNAQATSLYQMGNADIAA